LFVSGRLRSRWLYGLLKRFDTQSCRNALRNVVLSEDMRDTLLERGVTAPQIEVLNNFRLETHFDGTDRIPEPLASDTGHYNVLFAGNLGEFQGLDAIIEAANLLAANKQIRFLFMGEGLAKERLITAAGSLVEDTVFFLPQVSVEVAFAAMVRADLGLISLSPGVYRVAFPSKTMMYLAAGCPVLAIVEPESRLAETAASGELGYCCGHQREPAAIAAAIAAAWHDRARWDAARRETLRATAETLFGREAILQRWVKLMQEVEESENTRHPARRCKAHLAEIS
jgi:glycosyltransferase involved in cell wall biosynthesis